MRPVAFIYCAAWFSVVLVMLLVGCGPSHCDTQTRNCGRGGCCDTWSCGKDTYEVQCSLDGGQDCDCIKNGVTTHEFTFPKWCPNPGFAEVTRSANVACGWNLPGADPLGH